MTVKFLKAALVIAAVFSLASSAFASEASVAINNFAFNAGKIIMAGNSGDFFFSPYSIISAFGMAYAGAAGDTASEIEEALGITQGIHDSLGALTRNLDKSGYVSSANRVWLKEGLKLRNNYTDTLRLNYNSTAKELDIKKKTAESRTEINDWVSAKTNGKINDLLQTLDPDTQMVITNAVYFNAEWKRKFPKSATGKEKFYVEGERAKDVDMMKQRDDFSYSEVDGVKVVMLPYKGYKLSMIVALPSEDNPDAVKSADAETFAKWIDAMEMYDVDLWLPKFKTEKSYELKNVFEALGIKQAFTDDADFSGITGDEPLKADAVIHKTFIDVDEEKTEAAAATAIPMMVGSAMPIQRPFAEFHADHPFMYFIRDNETGTILFMGYQTFR
ncbi:MAG: serpin family protein [Synergistaceae bacterium]|nr:serpin family protein [Synergistaceae bacterium]MBQ4401402.1 serpin family protein [Synergistaceae bacterium]MBQ6417925.1 serpin family protein [Synergistaceae bacterium]MBQ6982901.1 serpin family protein [Synergistaceae bacterium]MBR0248579.1 serpin family protein [Synergistaceae bacterium]